MTIDDLLSVPAMNRIIYGNDINVKPNDHSYWDDFLGWVENDEHLRERIKARHVEQVEKLVKPLLHGDKYHDNIVEAMRESPTDVPLSTIFGHQSDEALRLHLAEGRIEALESTLKEAHRVMLHELDNGRTPYLLPVDNGGKGLGYFEDVLAGIER